MNLALLPEGHPDGASALVDASGVCSYGELRSGASAWRSALAARGIGAGDRVALVAGNDRHFVMVYLGALGIGAVVAPLNPQSPAPELASELEAIDAGVVIGVDEAAAGPPSATVGSAPGDFVPVVERSPDDAAVLLFTSGTAGYPKAAMLTHGSMEANLRQIQSQPGRQVLPSDVGLGILPLFHVFGLNVVLNLALMTGGSLVLLDRPDPGEALDSMERHGVTLIAGAPPLYAAWARLAGSTEARRPGEGPMATVRMAISGAAPLGATIARDFEDAFGLPLWEGYGLTEASPVVTSPVFEGRPVLGSVGVPLPGVEVRLVEAGGGDALSGDPGEVWVRGPNVFPGYWRDPVTTARVLDDGGWLHTGDVAVADEEGRLFLVERAKDLVIVSGFNVYPQEVEKVISSVDGVAEVAVAGSPRTGGGESVVAYVVREPYSGVGESDVVGACRAELAGYKCPSTVFFVDALPRAASGELLRRNLHPEPVS